MKVLIVTGSLPPMRCGVGDYALSLARALAARPGIEVAILTGRAAGQSEAGVEGATLFPVMDGWRLRDTPALLRVLRQWQPDVVHIQYPTQGYGKGRLPSLVPALAFLTGAKVVRTWHEPYSGRDLPHFLPMALVPGPFVVVRPEYRQLLHPLLRRLIAFKRGAHIPGSSAIPRCDLAPEQLAAVRKRWLDGKSRLIVFFGFLYRFKGADQLFGIADATTDRLVFAGAADVDPDYRREIEARIAEGGWNATVAGFLPTEETAALLAAADAVVLPFRTGGGIWNSSLHSAAAQGIPVITTSARRAGLDEETLIYFAKPDDVADMRHALNLLAGRRRALPRGADRDDWSRIAASHVAVYEGRAPDAVGSEA